MFTRRDDVMGFGAAKLAVLALILAAFLPYVQAAELSWLELALGAGNFVYVKFLKDDDSSLGYA